MAPARPATGTPASPPAAPRTPATGPSPSAEPPPSRSASPSTRPARPNPSPSANRSSPLPWEDHAAPLSGRRPDRSSLGAGIDDVGLDGAGAAPGGVGHPVAGPHHPLAVRRRHG